MTSLLSLPNEVLTLICEELFPADLPASSEGLRSLASLTLTSRFVSNIATPILYSRGVHKYQHRPLAWAAKKGLPGALKKALAVGADPNHEFCLSSIFIDIWEAAMKVYKANVLWEKSNPAFWPALGLHLEENLVREYKQQARALTPTHTTFDVFAPTHPRGEGPFGEDDDDDEVRSYENFYPGYGDSGECTRRFTALHIAAREGHSDIITLLLDHGADIESLSTNFCDCITSDGFMNDLGPDPWDTTLYEIQRWSPLHVAICSGHTEAAKLLVSRGAKAVYEPEPASDPSLPRPSKRKSPFAKAAALGQVDVLQRVLDTHPGFNVDQTDAAGLSALYYACYHRQWDTTVPFLLQHGANINHPVRVRWGRSTLLTNILGEACYLGQFRTALKLLDLGADPSVGIRVLDDRNDESQDPMDAEPDPGSGTYVPLPHLCCIRYLDLHRSPRSWGLPPPHYILSVEDSYRQQVIEKLLAAGLSLDTFWTWAPAHGYNHSPLTLAVQHLNDAAVKTLINAGAEVNACNSQGRNALMVAVAEVPSESVLRDPDHRRLSDSYWNLVPFQEWGLPFDHDYPNRPHIVSLLLEAGTPVNQQDLGGNTALHLLFDGYRDQSRPWMPLKSAKQILRLLLSKGADPFIRNNSGETPFQIAVRRECHYALDILARQSRIDPGDRLSVPEIVAMFRNAQPSNLRSSDFQEDDEYTDDLGQGYREDENEDGMYSSSDPDDERDSYTGMPSYTTMQVRKLQERSRQIFTFLLDVFSSKSLLSYPEFVDLCINDGKPQSPLLDLAVQQLYQGSLAHADLLTESKISLLLKAIVTKRWETAHVILDGFADHEKRTLVSTTQEELPLIRAIEAKAPASFAKRLLEAGFNAHQLVELPSSKGKFTTPLGEAIKSSNFGVVEAMLRLQPLPQPPLPEGTPHYLHWAVTAVLNNAYYNGVGSWEKPKRSARKQSRNILRALLAAGADTTQLNASGQTPFCYFVQSLTRQPSIVMDTYDLFKPLARGVDLHLKDALGYSALEYMEQLLSAKSALKQWVKILELEDGTKKIHWLK